MNKTQLYSCINYACANTAQFTSVGRESEIFLTHIFDLQISTNFGVNVIKTTKIFSISRATNIGLEKMKKNHGSKNPP